MKKFSSFLILLLLFFIYLLISTSSYVFAVSNHISDSIFRLHVIANSDLKEDQDLKYKVRDNILKYMNTMSADCTSKEEAINLANIHKEEFEKIALETIRSEGFFYDVSIDIGNFKFPTKQYGDISLPAGYYDALRIKIGNASGQNWWCVMFPSLCFIDISNGIVPEDSKELLEENLSEEAYTLINDNSSKKKFKFKLLELFADANLFTSSK